jgi:hypothetical protein
VFICQTPESAYFLLASVEIKMKVHSVQACLLRVKIEYVASDRSCTARCKTYMAFQPAVSRWARIRDGAGAWTPVAAKVSAPGLEPRSLPECRSGRPPPLQQPSNTHPTHIQHDIQHNLELTSNIIQRTSNVHPTYIQHDIQHRHFLAL